MKSIVLAFAIACFAPAALAGNSELSLAALVGVHSPHLTAAEKALLEEYLEGEAKGGGAKFAVTASAVTCRMSDVDIANHSCEIDFGAKKVTLAARKAHELYATLIENGVPSDGAAGSIYEALADLDCTIVPAEIKDRSGAGASCKFKPSK